MATGWCWLSGSKTCPVTQHGRGAASGALVHGRKRCAGTHGGSLGLATWPATSAGLQHAAGASESSARTRKGGLAGSPRRRDAWRPRRELLLGSAQQVPTPARCGGAGPAGRARRPLQLLCRGGRGLRRAPFSAAACAPAPQPQRSTCPRPATPTGRSRPPWPPGPPCRRPRTLCQAPARECARRRRDARSRCARVAWSRGRNAAACSTPPEQGTRL